MRTRGSSARAIVARRALIAAILFYGLLILLVAFPHVEALAHLSATLMLPGERAVYGWAPMHAGWAFVLANVVNFVFYYVVFVAIFWALLARDLGPSGKTNPE